MAESAHTPFVIIDRTMLFEGHLFDVERVDFEGPGGIAFSREVIRHPGAVAVVPVHEDGSVTLVRQMRAPFHMQVLEIVAGTCDVGGEDRELTARRELEEEAGLQASSFAAVGTIFNSPGYCDQATTIFVATGLRDVSTIRSGPEEEAMSLERFVLSTVERLIESGRLHDATTICGLLLARAHLGDALGK